MGKIKTDEKKILLIINVYLDVDHSKTVYVGDGIMGDVGGAKIARLSTVWINQRGR